MGFTTENNPQADTIVEVTRIIPIEVTVMVTEEVLVTSIPPATGTPRPTPSPSPTSTSIPAPEFMDDFSGGIQEQWENEDNAWIVNAGMAVPQDCGELIIGSEHWNNFALDIDVINSNGSYQLIFGYEDESNYLYLSTGTTYSSWVVVDNGETRGIVSTKFDNREEGESYHLRAEVIDPAIKIYINGEQEPLWDITVPQTAAGKLGFGSCQEDVFLDNFSVSPLP